MAAAGSGKTRAIVAEALSVPKERILVTTYTNENVEVLRQTFVELHGCVPANVHIASWFVFLLRDGVRPYQNHILPGGPGRPTSIDFQAQRRRFQKKDEYLTKAGDLYRDKVAELVCAINSASNGLVIQRLGAMYDRIFVDELQDLAGWDLELLGAILRSRVRLQMVGDPRQGTFSTNRSAKNKGYRRSGIYKWVVEREAVGELLLRKSTESFRCNQAICDLADSLFPDLSPTVSRNETVTGHDGVFEVSRSELTEYVGTYRPVVLRYNRRAESCGLPATNIGVCKGRTFDRVLILPTKGMETFLRTKDPSTAGDLAKFYVAVTRARYSVAFVLPN